MTNAEIDTEALFFRLLHSYLLQRNTIQEDFGMVLDHYNDYPESFRVLKPTYLRWLEKIQEDVKSGRYTLFSGALASNDIFLESLKREKSDQKHKDICRNLILRKDDILAPITGPIDDINVEHPTIFGPIDIYVRSGACAYIIEVKSCSADHSIIGQVMKYYVAICLKLILKLYEEVKMITICPGYDKASFNGLKQIGAQPLVMCGKPLKIIS